MYLWDASVVRRKQEEEAAWVRSYSTTRDALIGVENMRGGGRAEVPGYVKPYLKSVPTAPAQPIMDLEAQLQGLALLYPDNVDLGVSGESRAG